MLLPSRSWLGSGPWRQGKISSISAEISKNLNTHLIITGGPFFFTWIFIKSTLSLSSLPPWDLHICQFSPTFMCKTFQKQNDNNNINNDNNTKMNSTNPRYQNTVLNRHFSSAFSEISGLQRCNYHVLHTPNCTWSSPPPTPPHQVVNVKRKHSIFHGDSIKSAFRPKKLKAVRLDKPLKGRSLVLKQSNNNNINPLKYRQNFLKCRFGTCIPLCLRAPSVWQTAQGDGFEGLVVRQRPRWLSCPWLLPITQTGNHAGVAVKSRRRNPAVSEWPQSGG